MKAFRDAGHSLLQSQFQTTSHEYKWTPKSRRWKNIFLIVDWKTSWLAILSSVWGHELISFKENNKWYSYRALKATVQFHQEIRTIFDGAARSVPSAFVALLSGDRSSKATDLHSHDTTLRIWPGVLLNLSPPQPRPCWLCTDDGTTFEVDQDHACPCCGVLWYVQVS